MAPKVAQRMRNIATQKRGGGSSVRPYARPAAAPSVEPESRQPDCDLFNEPPTIAANEVPVIAEANDRGKRGMQLATSYTEWSKGKHSSFKVRLLQARHWYPLVGSMVAAPSKRIHVWPRFREELPISLLS